MNKYLYRLIIFLTGKTKFKELYFYQLNLHIVEQFNICQFNLNALL